MSKSIAVAASVERRQNSERPWLVHVFTQPGSKADLKQRMFDFRFSLNSGHLSGRRLHQPLPYANIWPIPLDVSPSGPFLERDCRSHGPSYAPRIHITNECASSTETLARRAARL